MIIHSLIFELKFWFSGGWIEDFLLINEFISLKYYKSFIQNTSGYTEDQLESIRNAVAEEMMFDLRDSVQQGRDLELKDDTGATAVSTH